MIQILNKFEALLKGEIRFPVEEFFFFELANKSFAYSTDEKRRRHQHLQRRRSVSKCAFSFYNVKRDYFSVRN